jgi:hypothetical protein
MQRSLLTDRHHTTFFSLMSTRSGTMEVPIGKQRNSKYFATIEDIFGITIQQNDEALLCTCGNEVPPDFTRNGSYPEWCLILRCRSDACKKKKSWSVCVLCINDRAQGKKMFNRPQVQQHNLIHDDSRRVRQEQAINQYDPPEVITVLRFELWFEEKIFD